MGTLKISSHSGLFPSTCGSLFSSASIAFKETASAFDASMYVRALVATQLQRISKQITDPNLFPFLIALDGAALIQSSKMDLRVRFYDCLKLGNYQILVIPIYVCHTGANMYDMIAKILASLCGEAWKTLIGISTDGASNLVGRLSGAVSRIIRD